MTGPIGGISGFGSRNRVSRDRRDKGPDRSVQLDFGHGLAQGLNHGIHHCGVEGMRGVQLAANHLFRAHFFCSQLFRTEVLPFELLLELNDIRLRSRHHTERRSIVRRDLKGSGKNFRDRLSAAVHRHHGTTRKVLH